MATGRAASRGPLLINRDFRLLLAGHAVSLVGDFAFDTTLLLWIGAILLKGSPYAPVASAIPLVVPAAVTVALAPVAGVFVDRWDKRTTMLRMDLIRAALIGLVAVLATLGRNAVPPVAAVVVVAVTVALTTAASLFFSPARFVLIGDVVPAEQRGKASSYGQAVVALAGVVGPPIAGVLLFGAGPEWAFALNAASFLVSYAAIRAVPAREPAPLPGQDEGTPQSSVRHELMAGLRLMGGNGVIRVLLTAIVVATLGAGAISALDVYFVQQNLHADPVWFGYLGGVFAAGALAGALIGGVAGDRFGHARVLWISMLSFGGLFGLYARLTAVPPAVVVIGLFGIAIGAFNAVVFPLILRTVPREFLGRTMSVFNPVNRLASIVSIAAASVLTSTALQGFSGEVLGIHVGPIDTVFTVSGALIAAAGLYAFAKLRGTDRAPRASGHEPTEIVAV
jgi:MFS family permease